jgi:hypothetical protein
MDTEYRIVKGFPNYRVGTDGSVWSFRYVRGGKGSYAWKRLKTKEHKAGRRNYFRVQLHNREDPKKDRLVFVHVLVLELFVGPCPPGMESCHWDDNGLNNALGNLRWDTSKANAADSWRNKPIRKRPSSKSYECRRGENHCRAKLTDKQVQQMRLLRGTHSEIAKRFNVSRGCVTRILSGRAR